MKKIAIIILCAILVTAIFGIATTFKVTDIYPASMIVIEVDYDKDLVTVADFEGRMYSFYGCEDWLVNDICALIMNNNGTKSVYDDIIIEARYCGWVE